MTPGKRAKKDLISFLFGAKTAEAEVCLESRGLLIAVDSSSWNDLIGNTQQAEYPNEILVRFVARNFYGVADRSRTSFLDIGCGAGANAEYLLGKGFAVTALDFSPSAFTRLRGRLARKKFFNGEARLTEEIGDAGNWTYPEGKFDCIIDVNVLCYLARPPYYSIRDALKKHGRFFCITPANDTYKSAITDWENCRFSTNAELAKLMLPFSNLSIRKSSYPDGDRQITSWVVEASR